MVNYPEYDSQACDYDKTRFNDKFGHHIDYMHKKILSSFVNCSGKLVLEVGVGTGRFATWLAKNGRAVVGIDLSKKMLMKAKEKKAILGVDVMLIRADVHFLPFKKGTFDTSICINVIDHLSNLNGFLKQLVYVVKSKGYFLFNFSNLLSVYLPIALAVNYSNQAMFKSGKIYSRWHTAREIRFELLRNGIEIEAVKGCFIASPLPMGNKLVNIIRSIDISVEDSKLKSFSGSLFVKAQLPDDEEQRSDRLNIVVPK